MTDSALLDCPSFLNTLKETLPLQYHNYPTTNTKAIKAHDIRMEKLT